MLKVSVHFRSIALSRPPDTEVVNSKCSKMPTEGISQGERQGCKLLPAKLHKTGQMDRECLCILRGAPSNFIIISQSHFVCNLSH